MPIPDEVECHIAAIRRFGNKGAHEYSRIRQYDVNEVLDGFSEVMRWAGSTLWDNSGRQGG